MMLKEKVLFSIGSFDFQLILLMNGIAWVASVLFAFVTNKLFVFESSSWKPDVLTKEIISFFSCRNRGASPSAPGVMEARSIGMEQSLFAEYSHRFIQISEPVSITGQITLVPTGNSSNAQPKPLGNRYLYCNDLPDNFTHEIAILAEYTPGAFAVISPCSHNGILNILPIRMSSHGAKYFIGGLHYVDYLGGEDAKKEAAQIIQAAEIIRDKYPQMKIVSGHCTCAKAGEMIKSVLGDRYKTFCSGYSILL